MAAAKVEYEKQKALLAEQKAQQEDVGVMYGPHPENQINSASNADYEN